MHITQEMPMKVATTACMTLVELKLIGTALLILGFHGASLNAMHLDAEELIPTSTFDSSALLLLVTLSETTTPN